MAKNKGKKNKGKTKEKVANSTSEQVSQQEAPATGEAPAGNETLAALPQWWFGGVVAALLVGLAAAVYLTRLHLHLFYGSGVTDSLCDFGGGLSCSDVNASEYSSVLGIPNALLAIPTYLLMGWLGWRAWRDDKESLSLLFGLGLLSVGYSAYLAVISKFVIGAWCLFCIAMYLTNISVLVLAWWGGRQESAGVVVRRGVQALTQVRTPITTGAAVFFVTFAVSWVVYSGAKSSLTEEQIAEVLDNPGDSETRSNQVAVPPPTVGQRAPMGDPAGGQMRPVRLAQERFEIDIPKTAPTLGPASAKVTIIEMSDFQCPFCKRLSGTLHQLHEEYPNDVRIVFLNFPMQQACNEVQLAKSMHPQACSAAMMGVCAEQKGQFWPVHDQLFARQSKLGNKEFGQIGKRVGLDLRELDTCLKDPATLERVKADTALGNIAGITGTPALLINGRRMLGAQPIEVLRAVIDAEIRGESGALALEVQVGAEQLGVVKGPAEVAIKVEGMDFSIDAFEASLSGQKAVSVAGSEVAHGVTWYQASQACAEAGKRLCTELEWVAACTGEVTVDENQNGIVSDDPILGNEYAYGPYYRSGLCADSRTKDNPGELVAGNHPACTTPTGVYDLHGNVKEWVGLTPNRAAIKGGSYYSGDSARCGYHRDDFPPDTIDESLGFRCCSGPVPQEVSSVSEMWPGGKVGDQLKGFSVPLADGGTFNAGKLKGKPAIIAFWASWCGPCKKEMPMLNAFYQQYRDQGLQVIGISVDEDPHKARQWAKEQGIQFPIALDAQSTLVDGFDSRGVPTTFWIKPDGTIWHRTVGIPSGGEERLRTFLEELMKF